MVKNNEIDQGMTTRIFHGTYVKSWLLTIAFVFFLCLIYAGAAEVVIFKFENWQDFLMRFPMFAWFLLIILSFISTTKLISIDQKFIRIRYTFYPLMKEKRIPIEKVVAYASFAGRYTLGSEIFTIHYLATDGTVKKGRFTPNLWNKDIDELRSMLDAKGAKHLGYFEKYKP